MLKKSSRKYSEVEVLQIERWFGSTCQEALSIPWRHRTCCCFKNPTDGLHTSWRPVVMWPPFWGCDTGEYSTTSLRAFVSLQCSAWWWWWCCNARSDSSLPLAPRNHTQHAPLSFTTRPHGWFTHFHLHLFCQGQLKCLFQTEPRLQYFKIINIYIFKGIAHHHVWDDLKLYYIDFNDQQVHPSRECLLTVSHSQNLGSSPLAQVKHLTNRNWSTLSVLSSLTTAWCKNMHR